jgi:hypothetical protein
MSNDLAKPHDSSTHGLVLDRDSIEQMQNMAQMMAEARVTVPKHLSGSPGDCLAVIMQAMQWRMNPFSVAQKTHLVNGTLGYEAQLVNAVVSSTGTIKGRFHYEYRGDGNALECRVGATPSGEKEIQWGEWLNISTVTTKNSSLWKTNPKQQIGYLQVKNWARQYAPGAILGVYTPDELETIEPRNMGQAKRVEPARAELASYPAKDFATHLPAWCGAIQSGSRTPDQIIAMVGTKGVLSDEQKQSIRDCAKQGDVDTETGEVIEGEVA